MAPLRAAATIVAIVLGSSFQDASAAVLQKYGLRSNSTMKNALGAIREAYTTNAICGKKNCINPVFPGMEDLHHLSQSKWIVSSLQKTAPSMGFCRNAVSYDPALPMPNGGGTSVKELVQRQDNAAATMFYYHITGLGLEAWDYQKPEFADDCVKSIWRMTCFTYFPRAEIGKADGAWSEYIRPCQSSCQNYVRACNVECCDESVKCVFSHTKTVSAKQTVTTQGYIPHDGPSSLCTGASQRSSHLGAIFWLVLVIAMTLSLQGCDYDVPVHNVGNWRSMPDYLIKHEFVPPGGSAKEASLNSCAFKRLSQTLQCSGRGVCKMWDPNNYNNLLSFCECDRDWSDPECKTRRKSQTIAYLLSMFFGFLGADQFYLGFFYMGLLKLFSVGGFGVLWVTDMIKIGSAPVYSSTYRTAADLPHYAFVLTATMFAVFMGFAIAYVLTVSFRRNKRRDAMLLQSDEESRQAEQKKLWADAYTTGNTRPQIKQQDKGLPDFDSPGDGQFGQYGAMGQTQGNMGTMPPTMGGGMQGMGQVPPNFPPNMGTMGQMGPPMGQMGGMPPMGQSMNMGPVPSSFGPMGNPFGPPSAGSMPMSMMRP